jgi:carboxyl-terminal processing protease
MNNTKMENTAPFWKTKTLEQMSQDEWEVAYRRGILDTVLNGQGHLAAKDRLIWGRVGDIGYLNVLSNEGEGETTLETALDQAVAAFKGARAVIVPMMRATRGGLDPRIKSSNLLTNVLALRGE